MLLNGSKKMSSLFHYAVLEVECICCAQPLPSKHTIVGIFSDEQMAIKVKRDVDAYRKKQGLIFPHAETVIVPVQATNVIIEPYKSMVKKK